MTSFVGTGGSRLEFQASDSSSPIHPSQVTFSGGADEPGHLWYPYLEGYSPDFVRHIRNRYMPGANRILDPFGGTGTTPITLCAMGVAAGYCEINPVLRMVVSAKISVAALPAVKRDELQSNLARTAKDLSKRTKASKRSADIFKTYQASFGSSEFFDAKTFDQVLRLRSLADDIAAEDELLGMLVTVAIMSRLVICSLLKRAGDVRFKTAKELEKGLPCLLTSVSAQLVQMAGDVEYFPVFTNLPALVCENAKDLMSSGCFTADGVITSPPYLNGTNYIRNTKLELWFIRALRAGVDLRNLRDQVITSGINDVVAKSGSKEMHSGVAQLVKELGKNAYDLRIPKMVAGYFHDMKLVLQGMAKHTVHGAVLCIDLGDSRYAGIDVPTPRLLAEVAETLGFRTREIVPLRKRLSKDRTVLSQDLIVLERVGS